MTVGQYSSLVGMRTLLFERPGSVNWRELEQPSMTEGGALVRPLAVAFCDADRAVARGQLPLPAPYPLGHEFVGEVIETSPHSVVGVGSIVAVPFQISCGACERCRAGHTGNCATVPRLSMYGFGQLGGSWGGALADLVHVPFANAMLVPLPEALDLARAANAADNLADAWRSVAPQLKERPGADVLVLGGGAPSIGLWSVDLALALHSGRVTYVDDDQHRLALAEEAGAVVIEAASQRRLDEHEITVDASGTPEGLATCLRSTAPDGVCTSVSIYFDDPPLPLLEMYSKNATLVTGRPHSRALLAKMLHLLAEGVVDPLRIADVVAWDDASSAVLESRSPKVIVSRQLG